MEEKHRAVLERNRGLLVYNIIHTELLYTLLKTECVLTDTMIKDVQSQKTQEQRNIKLLAILRLRGGDVYRRFRHVLHLSGHLFLADQLYGEDIDTKLLKADEVCDKFPKVFNHISDDVKTKLLKFLETKVREKAVTNAWLTSGPERAEVMESRKILFDAEKDYKLKLEAKSQKLIDLKEEIARLTEQIKIRDEDTTRLQKEIADLRLGFKEELAKQARFNAANNHSIIQLRERFDNFNDRIRIVNMVIRRFLEPENYCDIDDDPDNVKLSLLERNVRKVIQVARTNIESTCSNVSEKEAVLSILKTSTKSRGQSLPEIVQHYVDRQEKGKVALAKELDQVLDIVRGNSYTARISARPNADLKWLRTQMAMLREEVDHIKKKIEWKDTQISDLIKENSDLRDNVDKPATKTVTFPLIPSQTSCSRDTPDSTREMNAVYDHYDRYMSEAKTPPPTRRQSVRRGSLADVNLERPTSPYQRIRRPSRFDAADIDILCTAPCMRSNTEPRSMNTSNRRSSVGGVSKPASKLLEEPKEAEEDNEIRKDGNDQSDNPAKDYISQGRRHSLAELITIYESSTTCEPARDNTNNRLPVLQET